MSNDTRPPCSVEACSSPSHARGYCSKHYARFKRTGDAGTAQPRYAASGATPWEKIKFYGWDVTDRGCWEYRGSRYPTGYGRLTGARTEHLYAHRVSYEHANGPIADGLLVCHRCDNPPCMNPDHLFLGTFAENAADAVQKGRHTHGERAGTAVLSEAEVRDVLSRVGSGEMCKDIASRYGVSPSLVSAIARGERWQHVSSALAREAMEAIGGRFAKALDQ